MRGLVKIYQKKMITIFLCKFDRRVLYNIVALGLKYIEHVITYSVNNSDTS